MSKWRNRKEYLQLRKQMVYRKAVFNELMATEERYLNDIRLVVREVMAPLKESGVVTQAEINDCFGNLGQIVELHEKVWKDMSRREWGPNQKSCQWLLEYVPFFKIYFEYCRTYEKMVHKITLLKKHNKKYRIHSHHH